MVLYQHFSNNVDKLVEILINLTYNFAASMFLLIAFVTLHQLFVSYDLLQTENCSHCQNSG